MIVDFLKRALKDLALGIILPSVYRKGMRSPIKENSVIFVEGKEPGLPDSFELLFAKLKNDPTYEVRFTTLNKNHVSLWTYWINCHDLVRAIATTQYVFLCDASDVVSCVPLRQETKVVQLWHACGAFKKWGMSTADLLFGGSRKELLRHPFYGNLSLVTVSSPEVKWAYIEAMALEDRPDTVQAIGVSRTDKYFDHSFVEGARERVSSVIPQSLGKKIMLYAPTFRGKVSKAQAPDVLDIDAFKMAFEQDYVLLIKHHPYVRNVPVIPDDCRDFAFDVSGRIRVDELLCAADVCITDYSSVVFEYSLLNRPIVFFAFDVDEYNDWRGFYYEYSEMAPGPVFESNLPMIDYLLHIDSRFDDREVRRFCNKFMGSCDGKATDRIYDIVFSDANQVI